MNENNITQIVDLLTKTLNEELYIKKLQACGETSSTSKRIRQAETDISRYAYRIEALVNPKPAPAPKPVPAPAVATAAPAQPTARDWKSDPATAAQYSYLNRLNVNLAGRKLTKGEASMIISAVKSGDGVGSFNLFFFDGSN